MLSLMTIPKAQESIILQTKTMRLQQGFTQQGLARKAGISLSAVRQFEQKGSISFESFLKLLMALGTLDAFVSSFKRSDPHYRFIDEVVPSPPRRARKRGWRS